MVVVAFTICQSPPSDYGLLDGNNVVVLAPTSSGKTMVGACAPSRRRFRPCRFSVAGNCTLLGGLGVLIRTPAGAEVIKGVEIDDAISI